MLDHGRTGGIGVGLDSLERDFGLDSHLFLTWIAGQPLRLAKDFGLDSPWVNKHSLGLDSPFLGLDSPCKAFKNMLGWTALQNCKTFWAG